MSGSEKRSGLTRRGFLKATGVVAGAATLVGLTGCANGGSGSLAATGEDEIYSCCCTGNCGGSCSMQVHVKNGLAFDITMQHFDDAEEEHICQRGHSHLYRLYDPARIKYPMKRTDGTARGAGEWERISWDEAISFICSCWKDYQSQYGSESVAIWLGTGNQRYDVSVYVNRLAAYLGATMIDNSYDVNGIMGLYNAIGFGGVLLGNDQRDVRNAKNIVVWGANPTESQGVRYHYIAEAQARGSQLVCIDPNYTITASKADWFVPVRPGSDALLAIGLMQLVLEKGKQDEEFLRYSTVAPLLVKRSDGMFLRMSDLGEAPVNNDDDAFVAVDANGVFGSIDEIEVPALEGEYIIGGHAVDTAYSLLLERLSEYKREDILSRCDIGQEALERLADVFIEGPTTVWTGYGIDHYSNGHTFYSAMSALLMLTGNMAKAGAGISGSNISGIGVSMGPDVSILTAPLDAKGSTTLYSVYLPTALRTGKYGDKDVAIKSIYSVGGNPLGNQAQRSTLLEALEEVDLFVAADVYMTETCKYADIVLPAAHYFECDSYVSGTTSYVRVNEAAVPPQFESMGDYEIFNLLGAGMGMEDKFSTTREEYLQIAFDNDMCRAFGITWDELKAKKYIRANPFEEPYVHGRDLPFSTPSARAQFYVEGIRPVPDLGQSDWDSALEALPYWIPPKEAWFEEETPSNYPLVFTTERAKFKVHTQFSTLPNLLEIDPEPSVRIASSDAADRCISTNDYVRIYNDRGEVVCRAQVSAGVRPGVLVMDHGWHEEQFVSGHYNSLTSNYAHPHFANTNAFDCAVEIEKYC